MLPHLALNVIYTTDCVFFTTGNIMGESVENCLSLTGVEKLIQVPTGCAEQTMVKMAPAVYTIEYLDVSEQWTNFNPQQKEEAIGMIEKGTLLLLSFYIVH